DPSGALYLFMFSQCSGHSLWILATYITGETPFPEFTAVLMLDDVQLGVFDSESDQLVGVRGQEEEPDVSQEGVSVLRETFATLRTKLSLVRHRFNLTAGVHVQQRLVGCETLEDGVPAFIMFRDSSDGEDAEGMMYNITHYTFSAGGRWDVQWDASKRMFYQLLYSNVYLPQCMQTLKILLDREKRLVMRRVPPRVRVMVKQVVGGAQVTCLATNFYPRHINLTLLRDGEPVDHHDLSGGSVLPNANGLYQVRKTLMVSGEELRRRHRYTCTTSHLSLDNRLEVSWQAEASRSHKAAIVSVPAGLAVTLLIAVLWWRRRRLPQPQGGGRRHGNPRSVTPNEQPGGSMTETPE
uniref:Ig-like domain-containing protein n=1 Tax=Myripristis murdjan TaxID=586833 RepID=A0A667Z876_9TELE